MPDIPAGMSTNLTSVNTTIYSCTFLGVTKQEYGYIRGLHEVMMLVTCVAAPPTALANALVLIAVYRNKCLQSPANILFCGLAFTDMAVGLIIDPVYIVSLAAAIQHNVNKSCRLREFCYRLSFFFTCCSVIIVTCISVERWLILRLKAKFHKIATRRRFLWLLVIIGVSSFVLDSSWSWLSGMVALLVLASGLVFCVLLIITVYCHIFLILKAYQARVTSSSHANGPPVNRKKYRHTVLTSVYIVIALLLCLTPYICRNVVRSFIGYSRAVFILDHVSVLIVYLNSLINPVLYFWRTAEIRRAALNTLRSLFSEAH